MERKKERLRPINHCVRTIEAGDGGGVVAVDVLVLATATAVVVVDDLVGVVVVVVAGGVEALEEGAEREHLGERAGDAARPAPERPAVGPRRQVAGAVGRRARAAVVGLGGEEQQQALPKAVRAHADQQLSRVEVTQQRAVRAPMLLASATAAVAMDAAEHVAHGARSSILPNEEADTRWCWHAEPVAKLS